MHPVTFMAPLLVTALAVGPLESAGDPTTTDAGRTLRAGAAAVDITPEDSVPLAGYYHGRASTGVHDRLFAKCLVLESGGSRAAIVALDLISTRRPTVLEARRLITEAAGIPPEHVMISATHAHTGPVLVGESAREKALGGAEAAAVRFGRRLPSHIARSVQRAVEALEPARIRAASGHEPTLAFNRRFHMRDGSFGWNPGKRNPDILRAAGPIDPEVPVVEVASADNHRPLALYVNYAMHLDTVGGTEISADYPFALSRILAEVRGDDMVSLFTIGCAGDINHIDVGWVAPQKGHREAARIGTVLAGAVVETFPRLRYVSHGAVRARSEILHLGLPPTTDEEVAAARATLERGRDDRKVPFLELVNAYKVLDVHERQGRPYEVEVQVITVGREVAWVGLSGEIFVELGVAIKKASPFRHTIIAELANGSVGYVPTRQAYAQGQYEVISARIAAGSGEKLVEAATRVLRELYAEASREDPAATNAR